jgi:hypothetical protein
VYELTVGCSAFPKSVNPYKILDVLLLHDSRPVIPDTVISMMAELIRDCLTLDYRKQPSLIEILQRLEAIDLPLIAGVNSVRIESFVTSIEKPEM